MSQKVIYKLILPRKTKKSMDGPRGGSYGYSIGSQQGSSKRRRVAPTKKRRVVTASRSKTSARPSYARRRGFFSTPPSVSTQMINTRQPGTLHIVKRYLSTGFTSGVVTGTGASQPFVLSPSCQEFDPGNIYRPLFNKAKVLSIKYIFELAALEQTDDSILPTVMVRYNHDPDLTTAAMSSAYFMGIADVVKKTFTSTDNRLEYTIFPQVMRGGLQLAAGTYQPMPAPAPWIDTSQDVDLFGLQLYFNNFPAGQTINVTYEWDVLLSEPK